MSWSHRTANSDDVDAIVTLIESGYRGDISRAGWTTEADLLGGQRTDAQEIAAILADPLQQILVFEDRNAIVGCIAITHKEAAAYLGMITVSPTLQGRGLGRAMIRAAEAFAKEDWALSRAEMYVIRQRTELIEWYHRLGYLDTQKTAPFPYDLLEPGDAKRDDLEFVILEKPI